MKTERKTEDNEQKKPYPRNKTLRPRGEFLTGAEMEKVIAAAGTIKPGERNRLMVSMAFRHGLRCDELLDLRWGMIDLTTGLATIPRRKKGITGSHPMPPDELKALRQFQETKQPQHDFIFHSSHGSRLTGARFRQIVAEAGRRAKLPFPIHPHMCRHSAGYKLANDDVDLRKIAHFLGHRSVQHTIRYTEMAANALKGVWRE